MARQLLGFDIMNKNDSIRVLFLSLSRETQINLHYEINIYRLKNRYKKRWT